ncbi:MAG: methylated-DNA--[protein]-cysteine S-methyltransferase [Caulobacteraceae bacterium]|nr:methylated-DNA--[protein]-cysteine S-methyltransferase [Caulobacteraceae bacterium]
MRLRLERRPSPIGTMLLVGDQEGALRALDFEDHEPRLHRLLARHYPGHELADGPAPAGPELDAYFEGDLTALAGIAVATGGTAFQRQVWAALRAIPAGATTSYGELAARIGRPGACRAVGLANGANPVGIVVPCHRVIGANGTLTGYGGGLPRKQWLLDHERRHAGGASLAA